MQCESENGKCDGFSAAGGGSVQASWFFSPTFGATFDAWVMAHTESNLTISHYISTVGAKWRPIPILTLHAGIGAAHASFSYGGLLVGRSDNAFAVLGAVSLEIVRSRRWALAVEARAGTGFYGDSDHDGMADITARNEGVGAQLTVFGF